MMINGLLGKKLQQTRIFTDDNRQIPVTHIQAGPCPLVQIKTAEKDGYNAVQLGWGSKKEKKTAKPLRGHMKKWGKATKSFPLFLREVAVVTKKDEEQKMQSGDIITLDTVFTKGDRIKVTGISKGKGFAGVVKRYGFAGGPKTHGQSDRHRAPGSIGSGTTPGRVYRGKKMPGRMGTDKVTIEGLKVIGIDKEKNILTIKGLVPGNIGGLLFVQKH